MIREPCLYYFQKLVVLHVNNNSIMDGAYGDEGLSSAKDNNGKMNGPNGGDGLSALNDNSITEGGCGGEGLPSAGDRISTSSETLRPVALGFSSPALTFGNDTDIKVVISDVTSLLVLSAVSNELHKSTEASTVTHDQHVRLIEATNIVIKSLNETIPRRYKPSFTDSEATLTEPPQVFKHSESCNSLASLEFKSCTSNEYSQTSDVFRSCDSQLDDAGSDSATESDIVTSQPPLPSENKNTTFMSVVDSSNFDLPIDGYEDNEELKRTVVSLKQRLDERIMSALDDAMAWQEVRKDDNNDFALTGYLRELHNQYILNGEVTLTDQSWFSLLVEKALSSSLQGHDILMLSKEIEALRRNVEMRHEMDAREQETKSVDTAIQTEYSLDTYSISSLDSDSDRNMSPESLLLPGGHKHDNSIGSQSQRSVYSSLPHQKPKKKLKVPSTLRGGRSVDCTPDTPPPTSGTGCCPILRCLKRICMH